MGLGGLLATIFTGGRYGGSESFNAGGYLPDEHPDPKVRKAWREGQSGDVNGWRFDPQSGRYGCTIPGCTCGR